MYNQPVRFDGDIIITDPSYIMNDDNRIELVRPDPRDYFSRIRMVEDHARVPSEDMYDDLIEINPDMIIDEYERLVAKAELFAGHSPMRSATFRKEQRLYYAALNEYYSAQQDDWDRCEYGDNMPALGFTNHLSAGTLYGDWSCTTFDIDTDAPIGKFCADSGMVGVFLLDEVLRYNPNFDYHINKKWTTTWIKDFHGTVTLKRRFNNEEDYVEVVGCGNINFVGRQTGW